MELRVIVAKDLIGRRFRFGRTDGSVIGVLTLEPDGTIGGYRSDNESSWAVLADRLVFLDSERRATTIFEASKQDDGCYEFSGGFVPRGPELWHTLTEITTPAAYGVVTQLRAELYGDDDPFAHADMAFLDDGYPHTFLVPEIVRVVLDVVRPRFWLEIGSMLGGSAMRVAEAIKASSASTQIVCIDPFTGDVNMWAWEQPKRQAGEWPFLRITHGRPTIYDRFLANVAAAGHSDVILPIAVTSIVGMKLLCRLADESRLSGLPEVIYLDSAHEPDETLLELRTAWALLPPGGVLMGDDWGWDAVRNDVRRFAPSVTLNSESSRRLRERYPAFITEDGVLLGAGQWLLVK